VNGTGCGSAIVGQRLHQLLAVGFPFVEPAKEDEVADESKVDGAVEGDEQDGDKNDNESNKEDISKKEEEGGMDWRKKIERAAWRAGKVKRGSSLNRVIGAVGTSSGMGVQHAAPQAMSPLAAAQAGLPLPPPRPHPPPHPYPPPPMYGGPHPPPPVPPPGTHPRGHPPPPWGWGAPPPPHHPMMRGGFPPHMHPPHMGYPRHMYPGQPGRGGRSRSRKQKAAAPRGVGPYSSALAGEEYKGPLGKKDGKKGDEAEKEEDEAEKEVDADMKDISETKDEEMKDSAGATTNDERSSSPPIAKESEEKNSAEAEEPPPAKDLKKLDEQAKELESTTTSGLEEDVDIDKAFDGL